LVYKRIAMTTFQTPTQPTIQPSIIETPPVEVRKGPTRRELEALRHIAAGHDSKTTARLMKISKRTVDFHLANLYLKLGAANRIQAVNNARAKGYI